MKAILSLILLVCVAVPENQAATQRNILLIIADDFGTDSLGLYNTNAAASLPPTPTINSLATNGALFRNAWSYPTCSPTRCAILTGRYGFRTGIGSALASVGDPTLPASELTLPEVLTANPQLGYHHASFGKWHLSFNNSDPNTLGGWSHYSGALRGALQDYYQWPKVVNGTLFPGYTNYATTDNVSDALGWINQRGTNAWFLWLAFNSAHTPLHKPPNELHSYDALPGTQFHINNNPRPYYEAMVEAMDTEIGRLLTNMVATNANVSLTNTTIIFLGDNGTPGSVIQPPYSASRAKDTLYEGGIRVPFIISGAGVVNQNRTATNVVHVADLFATILELAGANLATALPANHVIDSQSLVPIMSHTATNDLMRCVLSENFSVNPALTPDPGRALRNARYKMIQYRTGTNELYDLWHDPLEATNLLAGTLNATEQAAYDALLAKSDEWQARPVLTSLQRTAPQFSLSFTPVQKYTYTLERRREVATGTWQTVTITQAPSSDLIVRVTDTNATGSNWFYRVQSEMP